MKVSFLLFLISSILIILEPVKSTQELTIESYKEFRNSGRNGMIKFYQPWCGHCTRMKPDWDLLAENVHSSVLIADVNCQIEETLCAAHHKGGQYPTILTFRQSQKQQDRDGKTTTITSPEEIEPELYTGGRGYEDLLKFVDEHLVQHCDISSIIIDDESDEHDDDSNNKNKNNKNNKIVNNCSEKERKYVLKWKTKGTDACEKEAKRLRSMSHENLTYELIQWLDIRIRLLQQLIDMFAAVCTVQQTPNDHMGKAKHKEL